MCLIKMKTIFMFFLILLMGNAFAEDRMTIEQIKTDYLSQIRGIVLIECLTDPERSQNQKLCNDYETDIRWYSYALIDAQELKRLDEEEGIPFYGIAKADYQGGCVIVKITAFKWAYPNTNRTLGEVIEKIHVTHHLPVLDTCIEGDLSDYGRAGARMEVLQ